MTSLGRLGTTAVAAALLCGGCIIHRTAPDRGGRGSAAASGEEAAPRAACTGFTDPRGPQRASYPSERYLVGLGIASGVWDEARGEEPAKAAAIADIVKQLRVQVSSKTSVIESTSTGSGTHMSVDSSSQLQVEQTAVSGAEVVARCFDPSAATFYVLAAVNRMDMQRRLVSEIMNADKQAQEAMQASINFENDNRVLDAMASARKILAAVDDGQKSAALLRALTGTSGPDVVVTAAQAKSYYEKLKQSTLVQVEVPGSPSLEGAMREAVTKAGAYVDRDGGKPPILVIRGRVDELNQSRSMTGAAVSRLRAEVEIVRMDTNQVLATMVREENGAGTSHQGAVISAENALVKHLRPKVADALAKALGAE